MEHTFNLSPWEVEYTMSSKPTWAGYVATWRLHEILSLKKWLGVGVKKKKGGLTFTGESWFLPTDLLGAGQAPGSKSSIWELKDVYELLDKLKPGS